MHTDRTPPFTVPCRYSLGPLLALLLIAGPAAAGATTPAGEVPARQTEFNENNYRPREIVNRLPPPPSIAKPKRSPAPAKAVTRSAKWTWKSRQTVERGTFKWRERNGRIDNASVCMNEKPGSLRYRDCRRGAKVAFARLCRERRDPAACHAQNNYSPLR
ncbi:hypothetical protein [Pseudomonas sp. AN-1]|uniref:hypothetical protein n=1 Tax=Pseudomonas sp. AN-1 TaxID=3096605 RepID=UPI002A6A2743|nr:hypothetical protein [Pseudomonas sp. AN-1]WPP44051.1 hypothetical protein SK095_12255 [Pseudomonas sp. AN-1]